MKDEWREKQTQRWAMKRNLDIIAAKPIAIMIFSARSYLDALPRINHKQFVKTAKYGAENRTPVLRTNLRE